MDEDSAVAHNRVGENVPATAPIQSWRTVQLVGALKKHMLLRVIVLVLGNAGEERCHLSSQSSPWNAFVDGQCFKQAVATGANCNDA